MHALRIFGWSLAITVIGVAAAGVIGGPRNAALVAILAVLEISLSFDNAVINATILGRMSQFWQRIFLTLGILIAVFGMRLIFPIAIVALTAHLGPLEVFDLALNDGARYAEKLGDAHPAIAAFGGIFLFMLFLDFLFDPEREIQWIKKLEEPLRRAGQLDVVPIVLGLIALLVVGQAFAGDHQQQVLLSGVAGLATYLGVRGLGEFFEARGVGAEDDDDDSVAESAGLAPVRSNGTGGPPKLVLATGKAAAFLFLYLEVIDASFSFDGVVGAFAISQNIFVIAAGLGIGAMYIRSLTVYLVRRGTLGEYIYLEHGAHYAIGALAIILAISIETEVPEIVTGLIGVAFIGLSLLSSIRHRSAERGLAGAGSVPGEDEGGPGQPREAVGAPM
ncbi:hypothetical protein ThrDRAFT_01911 [Frankia casuarinae]|uniref:Integral membrane protein TerC n=1 Tax=Frankia casuarinae (strain DSM 45818 / CECT 9043 / HFP020203 / CcI3) TaxID=106370 RepID=Q2J6R4_FRACC|nr:MULTISPECIES: DUF475 domain-containing protein [Frankia]ABD13028.1 protein of unknown function DUF475 [Frankia casuarinae]ETA01792.1 hypothetical protein CcI6DRAFT_02803 [Frankia sp. CcI6]EYT92462.1 hypothetical protein ThrDRAFT_01911 [Frankia casuarinae]KDA42289.1 hypothetical protein BMG523Draft_02919 [Frankia sp. BMG5.23]KFB04073.1 hypothetical protein ALLO2DRAFT_03127 [Frankia sp. Allo2]